MSAPRDCTRCGKCCTNPSYMGSLQATGEDVKRGFAKVETTSSNGSKSWAMKETMGPDLWRSPRTGACP